MAVPFLTDMSQVQCMHGGQASLMTSNTTTKSVTGAILLESDVHIVAGCPFTLPGPKPSPCVRIEWSSGASNVKINGTKVLLKSSIGKCYSPEGAAQGVASIVNTQQKASGL